MSTSETKKKDEEKKEAPAPPAKTPPVPRPAEATTTSLPSTTTTNGSITSSAPAPPPVPTPSISSLAGIGLAPNAIFGNPMLPMWPGAGALGFPGALPPVLHTAPTGAPSSTTIKPSTTKITRPKRYWLKEEDELLLSTVELYGVGAWARVAEQIPNRSGKQCRERYYNHLRPNIDKSPWTREEDAKMLKLNQLYGHKWTLISGFFSRRTQGSVKNRFYSLKRRHEREARRKASACKQPAKPFLQSRSLFVGASSTPPLSNLLPISAKETGGKAEKDDAQKKDDKAADKQTGEKVDGEATPDSKDSSQDAKKRKLDKEGSVDNAATTGDSKQPAKKRTKQNEENAATKPAGSDAGSASTTATTETSATASSTAKSTSGAATTAKSTSATTTKPSVNMLTTPQLARSANMAMPLYFPPFLNTANLPQNKLLAGLSLAQQNQRQNLLQREMLGMKTPVRPPPGVQLPMSYFTPSMLTNRMAFLQYMQQLQQLQQLQAWSTAIAGGAIKPPVPTAKPNAKAGAAPASTAAATSTTAPVTAKSTPGDGNSMPGLTVLSTIQKGQQNPAESSTTAATTNGESEGAKDKDEKKEDSEKEKVGSEKTTDKEQEEKKKDSNEEEGKPKEGTEENDDAGDSKKGAMKRWIAKRRQAKETVV